MNKMKHTANQKQLRYDEIKGSKLIRTRREHTMFGEGVFDVEFMYNDDFYFMFVYQR